MSKSKLTLELNKAVGNAGMWSIMEAYDISEFISVIRASNVTSTAHAKKVEAIIRMLDFHYKDNYRILEKGTKVYVTTWNSPSTNYDALYFLLGHEMDTLLTMQKPVLEKHKDLLAIAKETLHLKKLKETNENF